MREVSCPHCGRVTEIDVARAAFPVRIGCSGCQRQYEVSREFELTELPPPE